jgi:hypothetical protein
MRPDNVYVYVLRANTDGSIEGVFASEESAVEYGKAVLDAFWGFFVQEWPLEP